MVASSPFLNGYKDSTSPPDGLVIGDMDGIADLTDVTNLTPNYYVAVIGFDASNNWECVNMNSSYFDSPFKIKPGTLKFGTTFTFCAADVE